MSVFRNFFRITSKAIDPFFSILIVPAGLLFITFRKVGSKRLPKTRERLKTLGVFPIIDHYYEPLFNNKRLVDPLAQDRVLPGLNFDIESQLGFLAKLEYANELKELELDKKKINDSDFSIRNGGFASGDADFLYQFIRAIKPKKVIEIGCGESTKVIQMALRVNNYESGESSSHYCIEPYEQRWLDDYPGVVLIRERVETLSFDWSQALDSNDLLFIDYSHMIRPQGDVLVEYLRIIPSLKKGVFVHVHDIFSPRDYLEEWIVKDVRFWNEQYLLEALLSHTNRYKVVAALNQLKQNHYFELSRVCPYLTVDREPGSLYFRVD